VSWSCHRSSVAKAGAPVSPQSSPPKPLALLRGRGVLPNLDSERAADLLVVLAASGEGSLFVVSILYIHSNPLDITERKGERVLRAQKINI
jgi:hypothetical protein